MHDLIELPVREDFITVPDDGVDYRTADSLAGAGKALQQLANRTRWLLDLLEGVLPGAHDVALQGGLRVIDGFISNAFTQLLGTLTVGGFAEFFANVKIDGTLEVVNPATFSDLSTAAFTSTYFAQFANARCSGNLEIGDSLAQSCTVYATQTNHGPVTTNALVTHNAGVRFAGGATFQSADCVFTGTGRARRLPIIGSQSGATTVLSPLQANDFHFPTVTADQTFVISDTGAQNGDWMFITTSSSAFFVNVQTPAAVTIQSLKYASGSARALYVQRIAGNWVERFIQVVP